MSVLSDLRMQKGLFASCPSCTGTFPLAKANLFDATDKKFPEPALEYLQRKREELSDAKDNLRNRKLAVDRSRIAAKAVNIGQVVEIIAPSLPGFPVVASDCRSLFKPIDYVVFQGLTAKAQIESVVFVDVKSGQSRLTSVQSQVKALVECGKVKLIVADRPRPK